MTSRDRLAIHRRLIVTLGVGIVLAPGARLPAATLPPPQPDPSFERLFQAYAAGDMAIVERTLKTDKDYQAIRKDMLAGISRWQKDWRPIEAVFLLEIASAAFAQHWLKPEDVLTRAAAFVTSRVRGRPNDLPPDPVLDAFEIRWHRTALAMLQSHLSVLNTDAYLKAVDWRIGAEPRATSNPRLVDPHFVMVRAIAAEQTLTPDTLAYYLRSPMAPLAIGPLPPDTTGKLIAKYIADALTLFDDAAGVATEAAEASVRKAFLLHRLNRMDDALVLLDGIERRTTDSTVVYWGLLFRGRTLQLLGRPDEAARAFEQALESWPHAQAPAVALATLSMQQSRRDDALRWSAAARGTDRLDPWWTYWLGDARFLPEWMAELRKAGR